MVLRMKTENADRKDFKYADSIYHQQAIFFLFLMKIQVKEIKQVSEIK